ncbi:MAG: CC0125/CC1285 family lipoprotein [Oceanicaulis sp.]
MVRLFLALCAAAVTLAACAAPTPYQSAETGAYGYQETAIERDRFLVGFNGNSLTDRETVETFLLYRAAELTLERGFDHFVVVRRDTDADRRYVGDRGDPFGRHYSPFGFQYRYFHPAYGWYGWRDPFWDRVDVREVSRYEAQAEIVLGRGPAPNDPAAFEAREVIENLGPRVVRPDPR